MADFDGFYLGIALVPMILFFWLAALAQQRKQREKSGVRQLVVWNLVVTLFFASSVFLIGETYFRFFVDTTDSFAVSKLSKRWGERHYQVNNFGVRANEDYELRIPSGKRRLTIIGDSFSAAHGIKDPSKSFGNVLQSRYPELEVHVIAANGMETIDEINGLSRLIAQGYELDVVLLAYCINDISYAIPETKKVYERVYAFENGMSFFEKQSYLVNTFSFRRFASSNTEFMNYFEFVKNGYSGESWKEHAQVLNQLRVLVAKNKGTFAVATFPMLYDLSEDYAFSEVHSTMKRFWTTLKVSHLDLYGPLSKASNQRLVVNAFDAHPNELAHEITANSIEEFLLSIKPELFSGK